MNRIINKLFSHAKCLTCKTSMDKMMHCGIWGSLNWHFAIRHWRTLIRQLQMVVLMFHSHTHTGTLTGGSSTYTLSKGKWMPFYTYMLLSLNSFGYIKKSGMRLCICSLLLFKFRIYLWAFLDIKNVLQRVLQNHLLSISGLLSR